MDSPAQILSEEGPLSVLIEGYKAREQQQAMAEAISRALENQESIICEAGTGTGKTFAYLVPVLQAGNKAIVSTGTKHLQDQLFGRDIPMVRQALKIPVNIALLKGRANYLCLHRLNLADQDGGFLARKTISQLSDIRKWSHATESGDMAELTHIPEDAQARYVVTSTVENCLGQECDHFDKCFVFKARKRAIDSDLVVVNHHLFLADMALRESGYGELLPATDVVVFDEAHKLPDLASEFFSRVLSSRQILELVSDSKAAYYGEAADLPEFITLLDKLEKAVGDLRLAFGMQDIRRAWHQLNDDRQILAGMDELMNRGHDLHLVLEDFAERGKLLENCFNRLGNLLDMLDVYSENGPSGDILWLETRGKGFLFHQTPLDIAGLFEPRLNEYNCTSIYTSATLSVNGDFKYFSGRLGLEQTAAESWDSPFDFQAQALCYIPEDMPDPRDAAHTGIVIERSIPVLKLTQGRAFLLFTSYRALNIAAELIAGRLDYPILVQGEAPRTELLDTFRKQQHSVLLGTSSFWEGVDVRGQALSCVIIDKLPFAAPDDPVLQARMKNMEECGRNPFMEYQVPEAVIILKQGIGRLIRDSSDYGVLMLCDPRLFSKSYGKIFMNSLPKMKTTRKQSDVEVFFTEHENRN